MYTVLNLTVPSVTAFILTYIRAAKYNRIRMLTPAKRQELLERDKHSTHSLVDSLEYQEFPNLPHE
jgi:hypothetical protein